MTLGKAEDAQRVEIESDGFVKVDPGRQKLQFQIDEDGNLTVTSIKEDDVNSLNSNGTLTLDLEKAHNIVIDTRKDAHMASSNTSTSLGNYIIHNFQSLRAVRYGNDATNYRQTRPGPNECGLDSWYQMLSLLFMLLVYCQLVVFLIFSCSIAAYMKRFFMIVDDIPHYEQRHLPVAEGGRFHPLMRRTYMEYKYAFSYSWYVMSRRRVNRTHEIREL